MPNKLKNMIKNAIDYINVAKKINFSTFAQFQKLNCAFGVPKKEKNQFFEKFSFFPKNVPKRG